MKINILKEIKKLLTLTVEVDNILGSSKFDEKTTISKSEICVLGHEKLDKSSLENSDYNLVRKIKNKNLSLSLEKSNYNLVRKK